MGLGISLNCLARGCWLFGVRELAPALAGGSLLPHGILEFEPDQAPAGGKRQQAAALQKGCKAAASCRTPESRGKLFGVRELAPALAGGSLLPPDPRVRAGSSSGWGKAAASCRTPERNFWEATLGTISFLPFTFELGFALSVALPRVASRRWLNVSGSVVASFGAYAGRHGRFFSQ